MVATTGLTMCHYADIVSVLSGAGRELSPATQSTYRVTSQSRTTFDRFLDGRLDSLDGGC